MEKKSVATKNFFSVYWGNLKEKNQFSYLKSEFRKKNIVYIPIYE